MSKKGKGYLSGRGYWVGNWLEADMLEMAKKSVNFDWFGWMKYGVFSIYCCKWYDCGIFGRVEIWNKCTINTFFIKKK
jgi:hypothetical protein